MEDEKHLNIPKNVSDLYIFYDIDYSDQKMFQFHSMVIIKSMEALLNVTERILKKRLALPQLFYFAFIKDCCKELIITFKRTLYNI